MPASSHKNTFVILGILAGAGLAIVASIFLVMLVLSAKDRSELDAIRKEKFELKQKRRAIDDRYFEMSEEAARKIQHRRDVDELEKIRKAREAETDPLVQQIFKLTDREEAILRRHPEW